MGGALLLCGLCPCGDRGLLGHPALTPLAVRLPWGCLCEPRAAQRCHHRLAMPSRDLLLALTPSCHPSDKQVLGVLLPLGSARLGGLLGERCFLPVGEGALSAAWSHWATLMNSLPESGVS